MDLEQKLTERLDRLESAQQKAAELAAAAQKAATSAQATATRAATQANHQKPTNNTSEDVHTKVVIAGFPQDQPFDLIENVYWLFVGRSALGKSLQSVAGSSSSSTTGQATVEAPYILGSVGHVETHDITTAKRLVAELRATWQNKDLEVGGVRYSLRSSSMRTKPERERNARLLAMARTAQSMLVDNHRDKHKEAYLLICWKSAHLVLGPRRIAELQRNSDELDFKENRFSDGKFTDTQEKMEAELRSSTRI